MFEVFVDTSHWLAVLIPRDTLRRKAIDAIATIKPERLVTSELVLTEFLNHVSNSTPFTRQEASGIWTDAHNDPAVLVIPASDDLLRAAHRMYSKYADKSWSLTDCSSFVIMRERGIPDALTSDEHFEQAQFNALLRS